MQFIGMAIVGLFVGILARFFYPGPVHISWLWSIVLGIAGSYLAGLLGASLHGGGRGGQFPRAGFLYSVLGAMLLIFICRHFLHLV